jgi:hypothetical protein
MTCETARLHKIHSPVRAASSPASYGDTGGPGGPGGPVRSVHGIGSGSYPWRYASEPLGGQRLPHGHTPI